MSSTLHDRLTAVRNALAAVTLQIEAAPENATLSSFEADLEAAARAISRVQVLAAMHPDMRVADELPRGALGDSAADEQRARALLQAAARPDAVSVRLAAAIPDQEPAAVLAERFDGVEIYAVDHDGCYVADISSLVLAAGFELFPNDDQEVM